MAKIIVDFPNLPKKGPEAWVELPGAGLLENGKEYDLDKKSVQNWETATGQPFPESGTLRLGQGRETLHEGPTEPAPATRSVAPAEASPVNRLVQPVERKAQARGGAKKAEEAPRPDKTEQPAQGAHTDVPTPPNPEAAPTITINAEGRVS